MFFFVRTNDDIKSYAYKILVSEGYFVRYERHQIHSIQNMKFNGKNLHTSLQ